MYDIINKRDAGNVKSTMIDSTLDFIAPHPCFECGKLGQPLCGNCKYNIESVSFAACIICGRVGGKNGICISCRAPYTRAWCVGERTDSLLRLIDAYKFERAKACHKPLADLLASCLPDLPPPILSWCRSRPSPRISASEATTTHYCYLGVSHG